MTSKPVITSEAIERWWGKPSIARADGTQGLSAAMWDFSALEGQELSAEPCANTHIVTAWLSGQSRNRFFVDGRLRCDSVVSSGQFNLVRRGETPRAINTEAKGQVLLMFLPHRILRQCAETEFERVGDHAELIEVRHEADPEIRRLALGIAGEIRMPGLCSRMLIDSASLALAVAMIRGWSTVRERARQPTARLAAWQLRQSMARLADDLAEDISLADLAATARLSPFHFARAFKASTGLPPHRYQMQLRLDRARALLETTDLPVTDVAASVGYDDPGYFARLFSRAYSVTPTRYRRERRE